MPFVTANKMRLAYEETGAPEAPAMLLIMGLGCQLTLWPDAMVEGLAAKGFRVVRFDNRDIGLSDKMETAGPPDMAAILGAVMSGKPPLSAYLLDDMAADAIGVLDTLGIQRAHIVGCSMGGAIAQIVAARYPERVMSLTSIMASSGRPGLPPPTAPAQATFMQRPTGETVDAILASTMAIWRIIGSPGYPPTDAELSAQLRRQINRSYYPLGFLRQFAAIMASGSRVELLARVKTPTLVLHGEDDPLVPVAHGRDTASLVAGARFVGYPGMGHDLPKELVPSFIAEITANCARG